MNWWAFPAGVTLGAIIVAVVWLWLSLRRARSAFDVASGKALDMLGQVWAVPREPGEADCAYRARMLRSIATPAPLADSRRRGARRFTP